MAAKPKKDDPAKSLTARPSALLDTRVVYCGHNLDQLAKLPDRSVDLIYIDPPFNSNRNYEVFWGETKEKRAFQDRHAFTQKATHSLYFHSGRQLKLSANPHKVFCRILESSRYNALAVNEDQL